MKQLFQFWKNRDSAILVVLSLLFFGQGIHAENLSFSIKGEVQHPGVWLLSDLKKLPVIPVRIQEYSKDADYRGMCAYWGVPLQLVLEKAVIQKPPTAPFKHKSDMAICLANRAGKEMALSWGEVFYQSNPTHYLLAFRKSVVKPTAHPNVKPGSCKTCHTGKLVRKGKVLRPVLDDLLTGVKVLIIQNGKLVLSLENLKSIEIRSLNRILPATVDRNHVFSNRVVVVKGKKKEHLMDLMKSQNAKTLKYKLPEIGSGCGYHGIFTFQGYRLEDIFDRELSTPDFWGLLVSAPDGYRTFVSRNEIMGGLGRKALLAFSKDGSLLQSPEGKFMLILPNDLFFDRWIRAVNRIEILSNSR